jgi:hypothetical protein
VVRGLLGLLLELLDFVLILHLCRLAVDLVVVDHLYFRMMAVVLELSLLMLES